MLQNQLNVYQNIVLFHIFVPFSFQVTLHLHIRNTMKLTSEFLYGESDIHKIFRWRVQYMAKNFSCRAAARKIFWAVQWGMLPQKILKT